MRLPSIYRGALTALVLALVVVSSGLAGTERRTAAPTITDFTPKSGQVGTKVKITGTDLAGASVQFNSIPATSVVVDPSGTSITATVPDALADHPTPGPITVMTPGGTVLSAANFSFTITPPASASPAKVGKPRIVSFAPGHGKPGTKVTLKGKNFAGALAVKLAGLKVTFKVPSTTMIVATIPTRGKTGKITVTTKGGTGTSAKSFTVG
jgi:hypothetical protein